MADHPTIPDMRGAPPGSHRQPPHVRDEKIADDIVELVGLGLSQLEISRFLNRREGGGYSVDTLSRHYRDELDCGLAIQKEKLLRRSTRVAMGENVVPGADPNEVLKEAGRMGRWLMGTVHGIKETIAHELSGPGGGPIETRTASREELIEEAQRLGIDPRALGIDPE